LDDTAEEDASLVDVDLTAFASISPCTIQIITLLMIDQCETCVSNNLHDFGLDLLDFLGLCTGVDNEE
jgi:hypothetical protein